MVVVVAAVVVMVVVIVVVTALLLLLLLLVLVVLAFLTTATWMTIVRVPLLHVLKSRDNKAGNSNINITLKITKQRQ